jgi:hypothetical protein
MKRFHTLALAYLSLIVFPSFAIYNTAFAQNYNSNTNFINKSKLSSHNWYKFGITESGVYKITYQELIDLGFSSPKSVRLYGYGGNPIPQKNQAEFNEDMVQIPVIKDWGSDNTFNGNDYIAFYLEGNTTWSYNYTHALFMNTTHPYSNTIFYYLSDAPNEQIEIEKKEPQTNGSTPVISKGYKLSCFENNTFNPSKSGQIWLDKQIVAGNSKNIEFTFNDRTDSIKAAVQFFSYIPSGASSNSLQLKLNNKLIDNYELTPVGKYQDGVLSRKLIHLPIPSNKATFEISLSSSNLAAYANFDFICINSSTELYFNNKQNTFALPPNQNNAKVSIQSNSDLRVLDISYFQNIKELVIEKNNDQFYFYDSLNVPKLYHIYNTTSLKNLPLDGTFTTNQNIHGEPTPDLVILVKPSLWDKAIEFAEYRKATENISSFVITPDLIFNEFSSGTPDIGAVRNMLRMFYERENSPLKYLLIFGDGDYNYMNCLSSSTPLLPVYQQTNFSLSKNSAYKDYFDTSIYQTNSVGTDDFFGLLDIGEGPISGKLDLGIGRFPITSTEEADVIMGKLKAFRSQSSKGNWKTNILFIADDEDTNLHQDQAEELAKQVQKSNPELNVKKIYFDAFEQQSTPAGQRYPDVTKAINDAVNSGVMIIDYVGHGNPRVLSGEEVLNTSDVRSWTNMDKLSLFVTASCEVGRFDDPDKTSLGEWLFMSPNGGGVAALTTTRVVYAGNNHTLNKNFHKKVYTPGLRLGDIIRQAKASSSGGINDRKFNLLGDPTLKLGFSENQLIIDSVKVKNIETNATITHDSILYDTLKALAFVEISGKIEENGILNPNFNGEVFPLVFDKAIKRKTLINDGNTPITYYTQNTTLFNGKNQVKDGYFSFNFIVPQDINYSLGKGKISLYACSDENIEAYGYHDSISIGGNSINEFTDSWGPEIELFLNDSLFENGDNTHSAPILFAKISDETGINTTGNGFGHDITAFIDENYDSPYVLNQHFAYNLNSYTSGELFYKLSSLSEGFHTISLKVWDILNNSNEVSLDFNVIAENRIEIAEFRNYPNPASNFTYLDFKHNQANQDLSLTIAIFNTMGNMVFQKQENYTPTGFKSSPMQINTSQLSNGIYTIRINIENKNGDIDVKTSKMMILK